MDGTELILITKKWLMEATNGSPYRNTHPPIKTQLKAHKHWDRGGCIGANPINTHMHPRGEEGAEGCSQGAGGGCGVRGRVLGG